MGKNAKRIRRLSGKPSVRTYCEKQIFPSSSAQRSRKVRAGISAGATRGISATVSSPAVTVMRPSCYPAATSARTDASVSTDVRICAARAFSSRSGASLCGTGVTNSCVPSTTGTGGMPSSGSGVTSA